MALARLIDLEALEDVEFNAVPSQVGIRKVDATSQPVEQIDRARNSITDHISKNPNQINLDITLSNYDDETVENFGNVDEIPDTVSEKLQTMERWQDDGILLRYEGHNRIDDNVIIIDLGDAFTTAGGESLVIKLTLFKIRLAEALTTELNTPRAIRKAVKKGKQDSNTEVIIGETEADSEENKSILSKAFGGFSN